MNTLTDITDNAIYLMCMVIKKTGAEIKET